MPGKQIRNSVSYVKNKERLDFLLVQKLINSISNSRDQLIFRILLQTGITPKELVYIRTGDYILSKNLLIIRSENTKNNETKAISLPEDSSLHIKSCLNKENIFLFSSDKPLTTRAITKIFKKYSIKFKIRITPTIIRQLFIQNIINHNLSVGEVKNEVGAKRLDEKKFIRKEDLIKILNYVKNEAHRLIFSILFNSGISLSELINLKVHDFEFTKNSFHILPRNKHKQPRVCTISKDISLELKHFAEERNLRPADFLFFSRQNKQMTDKRIFQIIKEYSEITGIFANPRILRNSYIADSFAAGKSIDEISRNTGIKNLDKFHLYGALK